jgi:hypothetical protein
MAAYESVVDDIQDRLTVARKAIKDTYTDKDKKKDSGGMYASYTSAMAEIKLLEKRLRVAKAKVPKKLKASKPYEMSDAQRVTQGLMPKKVVKSLEKKAKEQKNENKKTSPPAKKKKVQSKGEEWGDWVKALFSIKDSTKIGGFKTAGDTYGGFKTAASQKQAKEKAAKKDAKILKDIKAAEKEVKAEAKAAAQIAQDRPAALASGSPKKEVKVPAGIKGIDADRGGQKYAKEPKKDTRDAFTKKMEKLLGLNRSAAQIRKDMAVTKKLEEEQGFIGGNKRGGRISKPTKKYAMNRGGKVASVRKPTRA